ncbi:uncharacterized protein LOC118823520 [Colossoma macropomum]|uniref:uncharacterized protein LOC118823520 n=1 Tax=Colossoma macropomum TaxID=42526 RepID=UPI001863D77B|nr:uncharacterized protein LOC118823520 [Colossoma macropomum]
MMAALLSVLFVSGVLSVAVVTLPDVKLGSSITLPCKLLEDPPVEQLDMRWLLGEHLVTRLNRDQIIYSISYRNRTELPAGGAGHGDFSLTITHTQHGDSGVYRCVMFREEQELTLTEIQLSVEAPRSPSAVFVRAGDAVVLPCFGRVDWLDSEAEFVQWKRGWKVLEWEKGSLYVDPQFAGRVSLTKERIVKDNVSLVLRNTQHEDQGLYLCFFRKDKVIKLAAQINLTVTDHVTRLEAWFGALVLLPLNTVSPVIVSFLPDEGNGSVRVCEVEKEQMECGAAYSHRTDLQQHSLELRKLSMEDSGTFSVMERETQRTVSVSFVQVFPPSTGKTVVHADSIMVLIIMAPIILILLVAVSIAVFMMKHWIQRYRTQESETHRNHTDITSCKLLISNDIQLQTHDLKHTDITSSRSSISNDVQIQTHHLNHTDITSSRSSINNEVQLETHHLNHTDITSSRSSINNDVHLQTHHLKHTDITSSRSSINNDVHLQTHHQNHADITSSRSSISNDVQLQTHHLNHTDITSSRSSINNEVQL